MTLPHVVRARHRAEQTHGFEESVYKMEAFRKQARARVKGHLLNVTIAIYGSQVDSPTRFTMIGRMAPTFTQRLQLRTCLPNAHDLNVRNVTNHSLTPALERGIS